MEQERIAQKIFTFQENIKTQVPRAKDVHQGLQKCGIKEEDIRTRKMFRKKVSEVRYLSDETNHQVEPRDRVVLLEE